MATPWSRRVGLVAPLTPLVVSLETPPVLALTTQPGGAVDDVAFTQQPVLQVTPAVAGVVVTASINSGAGTLLGTATATTNGAGVATFSGLGLNATTPPASFTLLFSAPGYASVVSSSVTVTAAGGSHPIFPNAPAGWTTVFDWGCHFVPPVEPGSQDGWMVIERAAQQTLAANMTLGSDASQPGGGTSPGFLRFNFPAGHPGGYSPVSMAWVGGWPGGMLEAHYAWTIRLHPSWTNNGNTGTKWFFYGTNAGADRNNHFLGLDSVNYAPNDPGLVVGLQNPDNTMLVSGNPIALGPWITFELRIRYNTPGTPNGQVQLWRNGTSLLIGAPSWGTPNQQQRTDILFATSTQVAQIDWFQWEPTYGGGVNPVPAGGLWFDVGHLACWVRA